MPALHKSLMFALYGKDIWEGFVPNPVECEVQGWNGTHPSLARLMASPGAKTVIDVGVWKGQSTITMANELKRLGIDGCIIAVDTFLGSPEHWTMTNEFFFRNNGMPDLYKTFLSNVYSAGVKDYVLPMPQTSVTAAAVLRRYGIQASVIHIDAAHEYEEVVRDAEEYWRLLEVGGVLIGDDYHETWPGVVKAAGEFSAKMMAPLEIDSIKWVVRKKI